MDNYFSKDFARQNEQCIFDRFKYMGYYINYNNPIPDLLSLERVIGNEYIAVIEINKFDGTVKKYDDPETNIPLPFTMKEFGLLHELFELWGWL